MRQANGVEVGKAAKAFFLIVTLALVLAGFPSSVLALEQARLFGRVIDVNGSPVSNCYIGAFDENYARLGDTYTDEQGYYELTVSRQERYNLWVGKTDRYRFLYIPQSRMTTFGRVDFELLPGANIIINAYDTQGNLMRNRSFRQATLSRVFATDMRGIPAHSYFGAIHDEKSDWDWNEAIPAFIVLPHKRYKIHVYWEVPEFGKVMLIADNAGKGYSISEQGGELTINLNYEIARSSLAMLERQDNAIVAQEIKTSAQHLAAAERYMNEKPADMKNAVRQLNLSLKYSLEARERLALARAKLDIEKYRKGDVKLRVVDAEGTPLSDCTVKFTQVSRDFLFGANPMGRNGGYEPKIAELMKDAGINHSYITARWGIIEPLPGKFDWDNMDNYQQIDRQISHGFKLMGALSLWFSPNTDFSPMYLRELDFEQLKKSVYSYSYNLVSRYKGRIDVWEINEINLGSANALGLTQEQKLEIVRLFVTAAREANPGAKILIGSTALPYEFSDSVPFPELLSSDVPADIIGLELYYSGVNTEGYSVVGLDLATISDLLDFYSTFGKPIYIKELAAPSTQVLGSSWWHRPWDAQTQAEYLEKLYTIAFSKKWVQAITWSWGISDQDAFIVSGGLLDASLNPKPAYYALRNLLRSWTTSGRGTTDSSGEFTFRGFGGKYNVTIESPDGRSFNTTIHVTEQQTKSLIIQFP